mgnify:FL=1
MVFSGLLALLTTSSALAEEILVAVASNFTAPMQEIAQEFEARSEHQVKLAFGSSGKFFAQINHGAPYQAFFSADTEKPERLIKVGLAEAASRFTYAEGKLALWSASAEVVDSKGRVLEKNQYRNLAIANPKLAPYGAAAMETLDNLKLLELSRPRWVQGENISQTYQFVASGNAELGLVALSQIQHDGKLKSGSAWVVPENLYAPIRQDAVILDNGSDSAAMRDFWKFVQSDKAARIIRAYGYNTPTAH